MSSTSAVLDIGSGLGHLSRYLCYNYNLDVTCIDAVPTHIASAQKLDVEIEQGLSSFGLTRKKVAHVNLKLEIGSVSKVTLLPENFGVVGLHTCGDLGPLLLYTFVSTPEAKFLVSVGCCYMKMTPTGFPMSSFLKLKSEFRLSYEAKELSCHAIEKYVDRLNSCDLRKLKIHCFRATLEFLIVKKYPHRSREGLQNVKDFEEKGFMQYTHHALKKTDMTFTDSELVNEEVDRMLSQWWRVVVFYSLRVMLANVIETTILLDRALYLFEHGLSPEIVPVFEARISSRNVAIICIKS